MPLKTKKVTFTKDSIMDAKEETSESLLDATRLNHIAHKNSSIAITEDATMVENMSATLK